MFQGVSNMKKILEKYRDKGQEILDWLNEHPEVSGQEKKTCEYLTGILKDYGYRIISPRARMKYSFCAIHPEKEKQNLPKIAVLCEYDAMEGVGHGCGHSATCAASIISALALNDAQADLPFQVDIVGTPNEEIGGGKIKMMEHGAFNEYEFAIVTQAYPTNEPCFTTLASNDLLMDFYGKQAHSSVNPWEGINALNGVQLFFHALDMMRITLREGDQVHGVILDGGKIPNVIPEKATAYVYLRAKTLNRLMELKQKVINCAEGCAKAVENRVNYSQRNPDYAEVFVGKEKNKIVCDVLEELGFQWNSTSVARGSSDIGNLDVLIPVFNPMISTGVEEVPLYSREFSDLMKTDAGTRVMVNGAKVIMRIIEKLSENKELIDAVKKEHADYRSSKNTEKQ